jgi:hypothetical protein
MAVAVAGTVLAAGLTACGRDRPRFMAPERSGWQQILGRITPEGTVDAATALTAFSYAIAPLPGVDIPPATGAPPHSGTIAVRWVLAHWAELTDDQARAAAEALGGSAAAAAPAGSAPSTGGPGGTGSPSGKTPSSGPGPSRSTQPTSRGRARVGGLAHAPVRAPTNPNVDCPATDAGEASSYRGDLDRAIDTIAGGLGRQLSAGFGVRLAANTVRREGKALAYAVPCLGTAPSTVGGKVNGCVIHMNPVILAPNYLARDRIDTLRHEAMHCFLYDKFGIAGATMPVWYTEGIPEWVAHAIGDNGPGLQGWWREYLDTPARPLFQRSYDAVGFYLLLQETGVDVWKKVDPMGDALRTGGNKAAWEAAGVTETFLNRWGPGYVRGRYPGDYWNVKGPDLNEYQPTLPAAPLGNGEAVAVDAPAAGMGVANLDINADVVTLTLSGQAWGRFSTGLGNDISIADAARKTYCAKPGGCGCPDSSAGAGGATTEMLTGGPYYIGVTGGLAVASVTVTGRSVEDFCKERPASTCPVGEWVTTNVVVAQNGAKLEGGSGIVVTVAKDGALVVDLGASAPVQMTVMEYQGVIVYRGRATGRLVIPNAGATQGGWGSQQDWNSVTATVKLTSPTSIDFGTMSVGELASSFGGGGTSLVTGNGATWTCTGDELHFPMPGGGWTMRRR